MSANRIVKRRAFRSQHAIETFHDYMIAAGDRHPSFQQNIRKARRDAGHRPTSTDMHWFEDRSY